MEFSVGSALATSFRVWFRNFLRFTLLDGASLDELARVFD